MATATSSSPAALSTPKSASNTPVSNSKRVFELNDKVFAKIRGYPPWPAYIKAFADETPNKLRYHVHFYGTGETAICKPEELFDYLEYREKYGKIIKRKFFLEALDEIERTLDPSCQKEELLIPIKEFVNEELNSTEDDGVDVNKSKSKSDSNRTTKRKYSTDNEIMEGVADTSTPGTEVTSRSGRKIKIKKVSDAGESSYSGKVQPDSTKSTEEAESSDEEVNLSSASKPSAKLQNGCVTKVKKDNLKKKVEEIKNQAFPYMGDNLEMLKVEVQLLDSDCRIKSSLSLLRANVDECLRAMDEVLELQLSSLMLKKHPEVVDTVKKLRRYVGNLEKWKLSAEEEERFKEKAARIRLKADHMYSKFKSLFAVPTGKTFLEVYNLEVEKFNEKTANMSVSEVYGLTKDPDQ